MVVVVVVAVVVWLYADIHHGVHFILMHRWGLMPWNVYHSNVEGLCPGMLVIHPLRAYALGCFNHPIVEGSCPGMCNARFELFYLFNYLI